MVLWFTSAMPNLVVYVPARLARSLEALNISEDIQRRACREVLVGLADGELAERGGATASEGADASVPGIAAPALGDGSALARDKGDVPRSASSRPTSKRKCSREARHHINHSGKPCPECGWPGVTA